MNHTAYYKVHKQNVFKATRLNNNEYNWLRRKAEALHTVYEQNCNGLLAEEFYWKLVYKYRKEIDIFATSLSLHTYHQSDPRGASLYVDTKPILENNYTGAYCIY